LLSWILVIFIVFQCAHSKLTSYILAIFPALALLAANYIDEKIEEYQHKRIKILSYVLIGFLALLALAVLVGYRFYKHYVPSMGEAYWLSAALLSLAGFSLTLLFKDKIREALNLLAFSLVPVFMAGFMIMPTLEPYISMYEASHYVPSLAMRKTTILTIKPYARGVTYHTDQEVAVMNINGHNYFSPHPIPILNTMEKVDEFLKTQPETFAIVKKSGYKYLSDNFVGRYTVVLVRKSGQNFILRIEPVKIVS
jgi:hypothetical protein